MGQSELLQKIPKDSFISKKNILRLFPGLKESAVSKQLLSLTRFGFLEQKVLVKRSRRKRYYPTLHRSEGFYLVRSRRNYYRRIK